MAVKSAIVGLPFSHIFSNSCIYSLVPSVWFVEHLLCPGPVLVTQGNYQLLNLNPLSCVLENRQKISGKWNTIYTLLWMLFSFSSLSSSIFLSFLFLSLFHHPLSPSPSQRSRRWGGRNLEWNGFPTLGLNDGTVSQKTLAADLWKRRDCDQIDSFIPSLSTGDPWCASRIPGIGIPCCKTSCSSSPHGAYTLVGEADREKSTHKRYGFS